MQCGFPFSLAILFIHLVHQLWSALDNSTRLQQERLNIYRDLHDDVFEATIVTTLPERQRQRLQESGGSVQWQSQPGQECQVTFELYGTAEHD